MIVLSYTEDEIIGHGYIQPYMEAEYVNIRVPIKIKVSMGREGGRRVE